MKPVKRGNDTFQTIANYNFATWTDARGREGAVVELVITGGVPDIRDHVLAVHRVHEEKASLLWHKSGSSKDEGPYADT